MNKAAAVKRTAEYIKQISSGENSGHDWWHVYRVWQTAKFISKRERADAFVVEMAALLHDLGDYKLEPDRRDRQAEKVGAWLEKLDMDQVGRREILGIVTNMSFSKNIIKIRPLSLEGRVVQDADRLDAIGAIGVMRNFVYAGAHGIPPYDPSVKSRVFRSASAYHKHEASSVNHFYEKLLLLKGKMNTKTGRRLAEKRHGYMEGFLKEFFSEWKGER